MTWADDAEKIFKTWADTQESLWKSWAPPTAPESPADAWSRGLDFWQRSLRQTLDAQSDLMKMWAGVAQQKSAPDIKDYFPALQELFGQWSAAQEQIWGQWLETLKSVEAEQLNVVWQQQGEQLMQQLSDSTKEIVEAQQRAMKKFLQTLQK